MSIISGPNLVGGSLTDLVIPVLMDHGPWEVGGRLFAACKTNETFGATVPGGASIIYSATSPTGPDNWTRETTSYPANKNFSYYYAQPDFDGTNIIGLTYDVATGHFGICDFNCSTLTYGTVGTLAAIPFSTAYPILLKRMPNGSTLVFGTNGSGQAGCYRYSGSSWSSFIQLDTGARMVAVVHDGSSNTAHAVSVVDSGGKALYYQKVFSDNTKNTTSNILSGAWQAVGQYGVQNYGHCYEYFDGKMFIQAIANDAVSVIESSTLDDTNDPVTVTEVAAFSIPDAPAEEIHYGNLIKPGSDLWVVAAGVLYDELGEVTSDKLYASKYNAGAWGSRSEVADFVASPPTINPPGTIPEAGSEYGHFHSIHALSDGTAGTLCDFFVDVGGVFCTTYYTNFSLGGSVTANLSDTLELSDSFNVQFPEAGSSQNDSLSFSDAIDFAMDGDYTQTEQDALSLSDAIARAVTVIDGGNSGGNGGSPGGSGGFIDGGQTNQPQYCIFEFYAMETPENVETLPVPKKYDQLGPMRFDKIAKCFGFRVRLIQNGTTTSMPYQILGDDSISSPNYNDILYQGSFTVRPGIDNVYEIQLPKNVNSDIFRLVLGPVNDSFHRYDVLMKIQASGMQGHSKWMPIR